MSPKIIKLILSFVIGIVLSFITFLILQYVSFSWLIIGILLWVGIGAIAYTVTLKLSNSKGIGGLCGVIVGGIGMWVITDLLGKYLEAVEMADTIFGAFLLLLPITLIWTVIIYCIASAADKDNSAS